MAERQKHTYLFGWTGKVKVPEKNKEIFSVGHVTLSLSRPYNLSMVDEVQDFIRKKTGDSNVIIIAFSKYAEE